MVLRYLLRKGVLLERTYVHPRRLPLGITAARDPMSRETPYPWLPLSHPRTLAGVMCTPRAYLLLLPILFFLFLVAPRPYRHDGRPRP